MIEEAEPYADETDYAEIPEPEVWAVDIELGDPRMPGGAKNLIKAAQAAGGWDVWASYSRGPWLHANGDRYTGICDLVRVRFWDDEAGVLLSASWRHAGTKWGYEAGWYWSPRPLEDRSLNSAQLKGMIKRELP